MEKFKITKNKKLTQTEAAKRLGKSKTTIVNWEKGKSEIPSSDLVKISELYDIPRDNLILPQVTKQ